MKSRAVKQSKNLKGNVGKRIAKLKATKINGTKDKRQAGAAKENEKASKKPERRSGYLLSLELL